MSTNVLKEFFDAISYSLSSLKPPMELSIEDFRDFVFNGEIGDNINVFDFSDTTLRKIYLKKSSFSLSNLKILATRQHWDFQALEICIKHQPNNINNLEQRITEIGQNILKKYHYDAPTDFSSVMRSLVRLHCFNCTTFNIFFESNFPCLCSNYVPWESKEQELNEKLKQTSIILLTGSAGSGKSQLIINTLKNYYPRNVLDMYWLDVNEENSIENELSSIEFEDKVQDPQIIFQRLQEKEASSILVIHKPLLTKEDLSYIRRNLCPLKLRIIISTYAKILPEDFTIIDLDNRPIENLYSIFKRYLKKDLKFSKKEFQTLAENVSSNLYVLTLIGKALSQKSSPFEKKSLLKHFEDLYYKPNNSKIHNTAYHLDENEKKSKPGEQLFTHIKKILSYYPKDKFSKELCELSIWTKTPILKSSLLKNWDEEFLEFCLCYGLLQYHSKDKVFMPKLLADTIWRFFPIRFRNDTDSSLETFPFSFKNYQDTIIKFFDSVSCGKTFSIPYTDLYEIIFQMVLRFHFQVSNTDSRITAENKKVIQEWNDFLTTVIKYYMLLGNYKYAKKLLPCLYFQRTKQGKPKNRKKIETTIQKLLTLKAGYMYSPNIVCTICKLQDALKKMPKLFEKEPTYANQSLSILCSIIQDFCDCTVEILLQYISFIVSEMQYPSSMQLYNCIKTLNDCIVTLQPFNIHDSNYYLAVKHYFISIIGITYQCDSDLANIMNQWDSASYYFEKFKGKVPEGQEDTYFKAKCMIFYSLLTIFYLQQRYPKNHTEDYYSLKDFFLELYKNFQKNIWSYHTSHMFYSCASFFIGIIPENETDYSIYSILIDCMNRYKNFLTAQVSLPPALQKPYLPNIDKAIEALQNFKGKCP